MHLESESEYELPTNLNMKMARGQYYEMEHQTGSGLAPPEPIHDGGPVTGVCGEPASMSSNV